MLFSYNLEKLRLLDSAKTIEKHKVDNSDNYRDIFGGKGLGRKVQKPVRVRIAFPASCLLKSFGFIYYSLSQLNV